MSWPLRVERGLARLRARQPETVGAQLDAVANAARVDARYVFAWLTETATVPAPMPGPVRARIEAAVGIAPLLIARHEKGIRR